MIDGTSTTDEIHQDTAMTPEADSPYHEITEPSTESETMPLNRLSPKFRWSPSDAVTPRVHIASTTASGEACDKTFTLDHPESGGTKKMYDEHEGLECLQIITPENDKTLGMLLKLGGDISIPQNDDMSRIYGFESELPCNDSAVPCCLILTFSKSCSVWKEKIYGECPGRVDIKMIHGTVSMALPRATTSRSQRSSSNSSATVEYKYINTYDGILLDCTDTTPPPTAETTYEDTQSSTLENSDNGATVSNFKTAQDNAPPSFTAPTQTRHILQENAMIDGTSTTNEILQDNAMTPEAESPYHEITEPSTESETMPLNRFSPKFRWSPSDAVTPRIHIASTTGKEITGGINRAKETAYIVVIVCAVIVILGLLVFLVVRIYTRKRNNPATDQENNEATGEYLLNGSMGHGHSNATL